MKFGRAIDAFIADMRLVGRINSPMTERSYDQSELRKALDR